MNNEDMRNGINPTAEFIADQHTGQFVKILPDTLMIKGAKNDRGFDLGYAVKKFNKKEYVLIDVVELATKEAVQDLIKNGNKISAILITSDTVLRDAYSDLETLSKDAGGADIYVHPNISTDGNFETKNLSSSDALLNEFGLDIHELPGKTRAVLVYARSNDGMLFPGDSAKGSAYDTNRSMVTRDKLENKGQEFDLVEFWREFDQEFRYLFPRQGKPEIELEAGTRTDILNRLSRGES